MVVGSVVNCACCGEEKDNPTFIFFERHCQQNSLLYSQAKCNLTMATGPHILISPGAKVVAV